MKASTQPRIDHYWCQQLTVSGRSSCFSHTYSVKQHTLIGIHGDIILDDIIISQFFDRFQAAGMSSVCYSNHTWRSYDKQPRLGEADHPGPSDESRSLGILSHNSTTLRDKAAFTTQWPGDIHCFQETKLAPFDVST